MTKSFCNMPNIPKIFLKYIKECLQIFDKVEKKQVSIFMKIYWNP